MSNTGPRACDSAKLMAASYSDRAISLIEKAREYLCNADWYSNMDGAEYAMRKADMCSKCDGRATCEMQGLIAKQIVGVQ